MFDPFETLGLEKRYSLELGELEKIYFEEQRKTHPDRFPRVEELKKRQILQRSGEINKAYLVLKDPLQRAAFLLKAQGIAPLSHDPQTLMEVMEWNERYEEGEDLKTDLRHKEKLLLKDLENAFEKKEYETARLIHYRLTYLQKFLRDAEAKS